MNACVAASWASISLHGAQLVWPEGLQGKEVGKKHPGPQG